MPEPSQVTEPEQKYLSDFTGSESEQRKAKSDYVKQWGYASYEALVLRSRASYVRPKTK